MVVCNGGNRSTAFDDVDDEEATARATRSRTCLDDCEDERDAVDCFAFRTRPPVMPAQSVPVPVGTSSGN